MRRAKEGRYEAYTGHRKYKVQHPAHGACYVSAPDADSAMVAAAQVWGTPWTAISFYTQCDVCRI